MFSKILIANRGEIACRVIRTANALGIKTVAVFSAADRHARHVALADEAVHIGGPAPADSYLQMQRIVDAAVATGSQAIHPGYGFLSENAAFCQLCAAHGLTFIGPPASAIEAMGSKSAAKRIMQEADVPLLPGYHGDDQNEDLLQQAADDMGYPVLLKAVAGGGGKGMRQVPTAAAFTEALAAAKREALAGFGDDNMLVEKYLQAARHVEVQVFCDNYGQGVYLFERDCSVQRRHQKIIEEAPAPNISDELRQRMGEAALRAAAAVDYAGAGTVEFLLDTDGQFYFMEMNTRLQVEHPVTEMITGTDLVEWQLQIAANGHLPKTQAELAIDGHAIEARIYAENPEQDFLPAAGTLWRLREPAQGPYLRIDTGVIENDEIGVFYDPMIAKLIVWGETRAIALQRLNQALGDYRIAGVTTNVDFLRRLSANPAFLEAKLRTDFIEQQQATLFPEDNSVAAAALANVGLYLSLAPDAQRLASSASPASPWDLHDAWRMNAASQWHHEVAIGEQETTISVVHKGLSEYEIHVGAATFNATATLQGEVLTSSVAGSEQQFHVFSRTTRAGRELALFGGLQSLVCRVKAPDLGADASSDAAGFKAPMNGTVVAMFASAGTEVAAGDTLAIMEAMKMEHAIKAPSAGVVTDVFYAVGDLVDGGADLLSFEATAT
jgi:3-methylcrotonyl-CoA carboxylase alpha subunit